MERKLSALAKERAACCLLDGERRGRNGRDDEGRRIEHRESRIEDLMIKDRRHEDVDEPTKYKVPKKAAGERNRKAAIEAEMWELIEKGLKDIHWSKRRDATKVETVESLANENQAESQL